MRKTKIICTIGPATGSYDNLERLAKAGMNVARLNMSHGSHDDIRRRHEAIRDLEEAQADYANAMDAARDWEQNIDNTRDNAAKALQKAQDSLADAAALSPAQAWRLDPFDEVRRFPSWDGSVRYLFVLPDGRRTEAVYMPYETRKTVCVSSRSSKRAPVSAKRRKVPPPASIRARALPSIHTM